MNNSENKIESRSLILPGRVLFIFTLFYFLFACTVFFFNELFPFWVFTGAVLFLFVLIDLIVLLMLVDRLQAEREITSPFAGNFSVIAQGEPIKVKLRIHRTGFPLLPSFILLYDLHPDSMNTNIFPAKIKKSAIKTFSKTNTLVFEYTLFPFERGKWMFSGVEFLLGSLLRIWKLRVTHELINRGRTYPNFKQLARGTELKGKPEKGDVHKIRRRGQGLEFESLRDYQKGDSIRLIDWRATSRTRRMDGKPKLIVRNYQEEQDQQILFIIDCGYRLPDTNFDNALEAMLMLSYIALKHGDSVAASSFGAYDLWIPPRKGIKAYTSLMNRLYDLHSEPVPSSPFLALENVLKNLHRRTFIILFSNFREEDNNSLSLIFKQIQKRHLLLLVSFRENDVEELAFRDVSHNNRNINEEEVLSTAAAFSYLENRRRMYAKWEHSGLLVLETSPKNISTALINKYLSVKKSGRL